MRFSVALASAACLVGAASAVIDTVSLKDRHFVYDSTGEPFFIRGVDYQPGGSAKVKKGSDPLSDINKCSRDIYLFQQLGINTIRVYSVDPELNHDECMSLLAAAGIYLVLDVNSPLENEHLNNQEPWTTYTPAYLKHIFSVIDVFSGYANTLAFLAGNEVIFDKVSADTSPNYIKAVVRDMKAYITNHVSRVIPVGYSNADDLNFRTSLAHYLECGDVGFIDFFGVNSYQWCGKQTFESSGYNTLVADYQDYSLPVFFTEFGCNEVKPRAWQEIEALYSDKMTEVFSGGLVYEFTQGENDYGLVELDDKLENVETMVDFTSLQKAYKAAPSNPKIPAGTTPPSRPRKCPASTDKIFEHITANLTLPHTLGEKYIKDGVDGFTRGKFVEVKTLKTKYKITVDGKVVSDPTVKLTLKADNAPLPSGGHGLNTGGGVGSGEPSGSQSSRGSTTSEESKKGKDSEESAASSVSYSKGMMVAGSLAAVAMTFGVLL